MQAPFCVPQQHLCVSSVWQPAVLGGGLAVCAACRLLGGHRVMLALLTCPAQGCACTLFQTVCGLSVCPLQHGM